MKRFISWVVLAVTCFLSLFVLSFLYSLATELLGRLLNSNSTIFWVLIIVYGAGALSVFSFLVFLAAYLCASASHAICPSEHGTRFITVGTIIILRYAVFAAGTLVGFYHVPNKILYIISCLIFILFGVFVIANKKEKEA